MLLYPLATRSARSWVLDLTGPLTPPDLPSVYALVVPAPPPAIYIGATRNLAARVRQHLSKARTALRRAAASGTGPGSTAAVVLRPVIAGRSGLLVIRLEAPPPGAGAERLKCLELAWLLVAAREELPLARRRGPRLQWSGDPGELTKAYALARKRRWPGTWIRALRPLCENRALPERSPRRQARRPAAGPVTPPPRPAAARPGISADSVNGGRPRAAGRRVTKSRCEGKKPGTPRRDGAAGGPR